MTTLTAPVDHVALAKDDPILLREGGAERERPDEHFINKASGSGAKRTPQCERDFATRCAKNQALTLPPGPLGGYPASFRRPGSSYLALFPGAASPHRGSGARVAFG